MAYADPQPLSTRKIVAITLVVLLHALIGYAFITGLAINVIKKTAKDLNVIDVKDEPPPPEEKPPPPPPEQKVEPPPMVAPPPIVTPPVISAPQIQTVRVAPPVVITPTAPTIVAPPAPPPAPPSVAKNAQLRGDQNYGISDADYPSSAIRAEEQGTTRVLFDVGADGRVTNCRVTGSSGSSALDTTTCTLITRRARYTPAQDAAGNKIAQSNMPRSIRWVLPAN